VINKVVYINKNKKDSEMYKRNVSKQLRK